MLIIGSISEQSINQQVKKKNNNPWGINLGVSRPPFCVDLMMKGNLLSLAIRTISIKLLSTVSALPHFIKKLPFPDD